MPRPYAGVKLFGLPFGLPCSVSRCSVSRGRGSRALSRRQFSSCLRQARTSATLALSQPSNSLVNIRQGLQHRTRWLYTGGRIDDCHAPCTLFALMGTRHSQIIVAAALVLLAACARAWAAEPSETVNSAQVPRASADNGETSTPSPPPAASGPASNPQLAAPIPAPEPPTEVATVHRIRSAPLGVGLASLGTSYALKVFGSLLILTAAVDGPCDRCHQEAAELLVPVAGTLLVANAEDPHGHSPTGWTVAAVWGVAEATAATLTIVGLIGHDVPVGEGPRPLPVTVVPAVTRGLTALSLHVVW